MNRNTMKTLWKQQKAVLIFLLIVIGAAGWYATHRTTAPSQAAAISIETVKKGDLEVSVSGSGQVAAQSQVDLKSVAAGDAADVTAVYVKNDQAVKKGQLIAVLDTKDAVRNVASAKLDLQSAEVKLKQTEKLADSQTETDKWTRQLQEEAVQKSRLDLAQAQEKLQDYYIRAPFDGIVTGLSVEAGDALSNDTILASVITPQMKAAVSLNEVDAVKVKEGDKATVTFSALPGVSLQGTVSKIDTIGAVQSGVVSYGAEITFDEPNGDLKPGMSVSADILVESVKDVLLVPTEAIITENGKSYVRVAGARNEGQSQSSNQNPGAARGQRKEVELGATNDVMTEIKNGLDEGDRIIVGGGTAPAGASGGSAQQPQRSGLNALFGGGGGGFRRGAGGGAPARAQ